MRRSDDSPRLHHVQCLGARGLHRMAWWEWGDADNPKVLVCAHGLSRQGRDFDVLAQALCTQYRVVCPDVVGRGRSDWLRDPAGYQVPAYVSDMVTLLARLDAEQVDWVGTSMGGLIGMGLAALPGSPIHRLVLNDVGPCLQFDALARIGSYVGQPVRWDSEAQAAAELKTRYAGFGPHSPEQWLALTRPMLKADGDGFVLHYDPNIGAAFRNLTPAATAASEAALWRAYDAIRCPVLLLRGGDSDLLTREAAQVMTQRGPRAQLHEFAGVGHAPSLIAPAQQAVVREFLE